MKPYSYAYLSCALAFSMMSVARGVSAQEPPPTAPADRSGLPVAYVERPLTLPAMTLSPELSAGIVKYDLGFFGSRTILTMDVGATFGLTDDLMFELRPLGFVAGDVAADYTRFLAGVTYRLVNEDVVELGGRFRMAIDASANLAFSPSVPVRLHLAPIVRIDTGVTFTAIIPTKGPDPIAALAGIYTDFFRGAEAGIPVDVAFQIVEPAFAGISTGYGIANLREPADFSFMPLGFFGGGTIPGDAGPIVDLGLSFGFPYFLVGAYPDNPYTDLWQIGFGARGFIPL